MGQPTDSKYKDWWGRGRGAQWAKTLQLSMRAWVHIPRSHLKLDVVVHICKPRISWLSSRHYLEQGGKWGPTAEVALQSLLIDVWNCWSCTSILQDHHYAYRERWIRTTFSKTSPQPCFFGDTATLSAIKAARPRCWQSNELSFRMLFSATSHYFTTHLKGDKIMGSFVASTYNVHFQVCLVAQLWNLSVLK